AEGAFYATSPRPKVAFVFPGQGAQWTGMARSLAAAEPIFLESLRKCDTAARPCIEWSILEQLQLDPGAPGYRLDRIEVIQPVLLAMAIAYADWLRSLGIVPDAVVGHSMGEVGAAYVGGALNLDQAMRIISRRSALMARTSGQGAMALVELSMADAAVRLAGREDRVAVAVSNGPRSTVISGEPQAVQGVLDQCERDGVFCRLVKVDVASHSPQMDIPAAALVAELQGLEPSDANVPVFSSVLGGLAKGRQFDAAYWGRNMRQPVRFFDALSALLADEVTVFVELSPHPVLSGAVQQTAQARGAKNVAAIACGHRDESEVVAARTVAAHLWTAGYPLEWGRVFRQQGQPVPLPLYPWQRERHWAAAAERPSPGAGGRSAVTLARPDEETLEWLYQLAWTENPPVQSAAASGHWLLIGSEAAPAQALSNAMVAAGARCSVVTAPTVLEAID
ncbi:MAG: acyltransferase domain-containing protein, partial [Steroidobacteraceae bacterium]